MLGKFKIHGSLVELFLCKDDNITNRITAVIAILCQLTLTLVLFISLLEGDDQKQSSPDDDSGSLPKYFILPEAVYITPFIATFTMMLVGKQLANSLALHRAYPEMRKSLWGFFDVFGNVFIGVSLLFIQVTIVIKQDNRLEYVLNSVATIFIIELDDQAVFEDLDGIAVLNRRYLANSLKSMIEEMSKIYLLSISSREL